jgi:hypothetical protein
MSRVVPVKLVFSTVAPPVLLSDPQADTAKPRASAAAAAKVRRLAVICTPYEGDGDAWGLDGAPVRR